MKPPYHTALKAGHTLQALPEHDRVQFTHGSAMTWDIRRDDIPEDLYKCDVLYSEIAWPAGMKTFDERAGVLSTDYGDYATRVSDVILHLKVPAVIVCGKPCLPYFKKADMTGSVLLNGGKAVAVFWNGAVSGATTNTGLLEDLARSSACVGDFCCGYGLSGRVFREYGKRFFLSDYNPVCIGYIRDHAESWGPGK